MEADFLLDFVSAHSNGSDAPAVALGLEMVEQPFQHVLDRFYSGQLSVTELEAATEWPERWGWRFWKYLPVLEAARAARVPLLALNVPRELQRRVQLRGLQALDTQESQRYLPHPSSFRETQALPGFQDYLKAVVLPAYEDALRGGLLASRNDAEATPDNFAAVRLLRDEAMATAAARWVAGGGGEERSIVILVGFQHAMFEYGLVARLRRMMTGLAAKAEIASVLLNPTPEDSLSSAEEEEGWQLSLPVATAARPAWPRLADFLWMCD